MDQTDTNTITPETTLDELDSLLQAGPYRWSHGSTPTLDAALAKAQGEMRAAEENRRNSHLKSSYADLGSVIRAVRSACSTHGMRSRTERSAVRSATTRPCPPRWRNT